MKTDGEFYELTTIPEYSEDRTAVLRVVKTESELIGHLHVHVSTHTFGLQSRVTKPTNTEYIPIT